MSCSCNIDYDPPSLYTSRTRTARKPHTCIECGHVICPGEQYQEATGLWGGAFGRYRTCAPCADLQEVLGCIVHGALIDTYAAYLEDSPVVWGGTEYGTAWGKASAVLQGHRSRTKPT